MENIVLEEKEEIVHVSLNYLMDTLKKGLKSVKKSKSNFDKLRFIAYKNLSKDGLIHIRREVVGSDEKIIFTFNINGRKEEVVACNLEFLNTASIDEGIISKLITLSPLFPKVFPTDVGLFLMDEKGADIESTLGAFHMVYDEDIDTPCIIFTQDNFYFEEGFTKKDNKFKCDLERALKDKSLVSPDLNLSTDPRDEMMITFTSLPKIIQDEIIQREMPKGSLIRKRHHK